MPKPRRMPAGIDQAGSHLPGGDPSRCLDERFCSVDNDFTVWNEWMNEPLKRGRGAPRGCAVQSACKWQALYSLQTFNAAMRAVGGPIPVGGRAWHGGGTMRSGIGGNSTIEGGSAKPINGGVSKFPFGTGASGMGAKSAQQSSLSEEQVLQQSSFRSSGSSKQIRTGMAAAGSRIPRQITRMVAVSLRIW